MMIEKKAIRQFEHIDLARTPTKDWPDEAKLFARLILSKPGKIEEMHRQLFPELWLIEKIERMAVAVERGQTEIENWLKSC